MKELGKVKDRAHKFIEKAILTQVLDGTDSQVRHQAQSFIEFKAVAKVCKKEIDKKMIKISLDAMSK